MGIIKFIRESFSDASGKGNGTWLTVFGCCCLLFAAPPIYWVGRIYGYDLKLPSSYWYSIVGIAITGLGIGGIEQIKLIDKIKSLTQECLPEDEPTSKEQ